MNALQELLTGLHEANLWEDTIELKRNAYLKAAGSTNTNVYFIEEGALRIFVIDDFEEHTIRFGYRNNLIAALDSYITEAPSEMYIQALKASRVRRVSKEKYTRFIQSENKWQDCWRVLLEQLVYQQMERERDLLTSSPMLRYQRVLDRSPQLFQEIPHKYIASYLRMSAETLSRLQKS